MPPHGPQTSASPEAFRTSRTLSTADPYPDSPTPSTLRYLFTGTEEVVVRV